jgi:hypothetical protein
VGSWREMRHMSVCEVCDIILRYELVTLATERFHIAVPEAESFSVPRLKGNFKVICKNGSL